MTLEILMLEAWVLQKSDLVYIPLVKKGGLCYWCPCTNQTLGKTCTQECHIKTTTKLCNKCLRGASQQRVVEQISNSPSKGTYTASTVVPSSSFQKWEVIKAC